MNTKLREVPGRVSVVIPCYNAAAFIGETVQSIVVQEVPDYEIIIVDDGSVDGLKQVCADLGIPQLRYVHQKNQGVSAARNVGLLHATGEFVVFFDADDLMSPGFLSARKMMLEENSEIGFVAGSCVTFPVSGPTRWGAALNIPEEILHYKAEYVTCPSNYLIRKSILIKAGLEFNTQLSSTADRFFLLQLNRVAKGALVHDGPLKYRVSEHSMSHHLSYRLIEDNNRFLQLVMQQNLVPRELKDEFFFRIYYVLGLGYLRTGARMKGLGFMSRIVLNYPVRLIQEVRRKLLN